MLSTENNNKDMMKMIDMTKKKRVVVKVGTSTLTHSTGLLNIRRVEQLVKTLADLQNAGHEIILVSSGAVGLGRAKLGIKERPKDTPTRQACAAVGQCELMYLYDNLFSEYSLNVAQLLLTKYILLEDRRINVQNALNRIIELGSIPIVNENDTVSIDELELEMGENDSLAANVAVLANADLLIIMSDIEGLFDKDPHKYDDAELIPVVPEITEEIKAIAGGAGSSLGTGGMATKMSRPNVLYFSICANLLLPLASMRSTSFTKRVLRIQSKILLIKSRMNGVGKMVPMKQISMAGNKSTPSIFAATRPPRSSMMGIMERMNTVSSPGIIFLKKLTSASTILNCSFHDPFFFKFPKSSANKYTKRHGFYFSF